MVLLSEEKERPSRPNWFTEFWGIALAHFSHTNYEELLETALAAGKRIDEGNIDEAQMLVFQAKQALQTDAMYEGHGGEAGSTQVVDMIRCGHYPVDLTNIAKKIVSVKYPKTNLLK